MADLPHGLTRYSGANTFSATDARGTNFQVYQGPNDTAICVKVPIGSTKADLVPLPATITGRPSIECNPFVGLWIIGNKEVPNTQTAPRYAIPDFVPFTLPTAQPGTGLPNPEVVSAIAALSMENYPNGGVPYTNDDILKDGKWYQRMNKGVARLIETISAVRQIQRVLIAVGLLRES
jgi:hypothetical protein